ncbi:MAG TPA: alcohol dehydrogenase catalytic domain-containing protein [Gaiellaceae bacterium]|nr:alcohol dehydrogenase catalytic domain-containing protein [Gaiellaceae bacterium]
MRRRRLDGAVERGQIRAAVMTAPGEIGVERFAVPDPEPGAVVLRVGLSGVCGTDKHTFRGETAQYAGTPHERRLAYPLICGHENVGVIEAIGGEVRAFDGTLLAVGDRIVPGANVPCGTCWYCANDEPYYLCEHLEDYGNSLNVSRPPSLFGGWAESMYLLPGTPLFRVPDGLEDELAVLTEPMAVTHGVETARLVLGVTAGESVVVLGVGPLGLCHLLKSRLTGCGELIAIDRFASRLESAAALGATLTLNASELDQDELVARVHEHTARGADVVHDCSGVPDTFGTALRMARPGGVVVESGDFVDLGPVEINPNRDICTRSVTVIGVGGERATAYGPSLELLAANREALAVDRIVTHRLPLERAADALEISQRDGAMKVVLDPQL